MKSGRSDSLLKFSLFLHFVWLVLFLSVVLFGPYDKSSQEYGYFDWVFACGWCRVPADSIAAASSMGKLEILSISLTVLGTVLAVGAFGSFFLIRGAAMDSAADEAVRVIERKLPEILDDERIVQILTQPRFLLTLANQVESAISSKESGMSNADADDIAKYVDGE